MNTQSLHIWTPTFFNGLNSANLTYELKPEFLSYFENQQNVLFYITLSVIRLLLRWTHLMIHWKMDTFMRWHWQTICRAWSNQWKMIADIRHNGVDVFWTLHLNILIIANILSKKLQYIFKILEVTNIQSVFSISKYLQKMWSCSNFN